MNDDIPSVAVEYTLYAANGRIYARNPVGALIDLGALRDDSGTYSFILDGDGVEGEGFGSEAEALEAAANSLDFFFLDGQFTSLPDQSADVDVTEAASFSFLLRDRIPDSQILPRDPTPHIF